MLSVCARASIFFCLFARFILHSFSNVCDVIFFSLLLWLPVVVVVVVVVHVVVWRDAGVLQLNSHVLHGELVNIQPNKWNATHAKHIHPERGLDDDAPSHARQNHTAKKRKDILFVQRKEEYGNGMRHE